MNSVRALCGEINSVTIARFFPKLELFGGHGECTDAREG